MVGEDDGVGQGRGVDLIVVAVEGRQLPGALGRSQPAALPPPVSIARHIIDRWLAGEFS